MLEQLEAAALGANHDVRSAVARLDAARAVFDEDRRNQYPKVAVGAAVDVRDQAIPGFFDQPLRVNTYRAGFDASRSSGCTVRLAESSSTAIERRPSSGRTLPRRLV